MAGKRLGDILLENGYLSADQLEMVIAEQQQRPGTPLGQICLDRGLLTQEQLQSILIAYDKRIPLGEMLVHGGVITDEQLEQARTEQKESGGLLGDVLLRKQHVDEDTLTRFLAQQHNYPMIDLEQVEAAPSLRSVLSSAYAAQNEIVPFRLEGRDLSVALADPNRARCIYDVASMTRLRVHAYLASRSAVVRFYERLYGQANAPDGGDTGDDTWDMLPAADIAGDLEAAKTSRPTAARRERPYLPSMKSKKSAEPVDTSALWSDVVSDDAPDKEPEDFLQDDEGIEVLETDVAETRDLGHSSKDSPVVETIVQTIISRALALGASDIHLEKTVNGAALRLRVDGVLHRYRLGQLDDSFHNSYRSVVARLKVMCEMDITEKRRPQDASFRMLIRRDGKLSNVDFRVSTVPSRFGEGMVIRVLDHKKAPKSLEALGLSPGICDQFKSLIKRPTGIILVTGPTGSGKSTTLYAAVRTLYDPKIKILTAEDPIEYTHPGICQTEVNTAIGNTFAHFLRSFLRQDPDVIMVGEIRDGETAEMALRAAQTGHLLLSTLHTINATGAVQRLEHIGMEPNSIASTLNGVLAQRLIRKNCSRCVDVIDPPLEIAKEWFREIPDIQWRAGKGCSACNHTGFSGRAAVNELWIPSAQEGILINKQVDPDELRQAALTHTLSLAEDALLKVFLGLSTLEEALRVVPFEDVARLREHGPDRVLAEWQRVEARKAA
ncbi:MAG: Flp pilus assembly complex ATPase component TadA [Candidatus Eisenbacteria bacterium]|uniref:Flp pilus assembly complex ATPase component TadA n=1 Tax=Eiseniibacteriota bacterium TaxID=2212470 RepID=A0A956LZP4_UNCEI|nr:Flp pilus assembly complex ATPase component TadA [Candidatus Eisenbacteria bacterium]